MTLDDAREMGPEVAPEDDEPRYFVTPKGLMALAEQSDWEDWQEAKVTTGAMTATNVERKGGKWVVTGPVASHATAFIHEALWVALARLGEAKANEAVFYGGVIQDIHPNAE